MAFGAKKIENQLQQSLTTWDFSQLNAKDGAVAQRI